MVKIEESSNEDRFHRRKHPRLKQYDYTTPNYYFITICTHQKECIFGFSDSLSPYGCLVKKAMEQITCHYENVQVDKYVIMPNHVHIILILGDGAKSVTEIVGSFKSYVSKRIHQLSPDKKVWQTSFHDHVIRNQAGYENIWNYIETNPLRWREDCFYTVSDL